MAVKKINSALISVFHKDGLEPIVQALDKLGVTIYSTGGTQQFIENHENRLTDNKKTCNELSYPDEMVMNYEVLLRNCQSELLI